MRTLNANLLTAQAAGYPTGGYQPAVRCILTPSKAGLTTYDYSFDPTATSNRLQHIQQVEEIQADSGVILLSNYDHTISPDLIGYYVNIGWGLNTADGIKYNEAAGAVSPRLWVLNQQDISGAPKGDRPNLYTVLTLAGVWQAVLNCQPIRLGAAPYFRDNRDPDDPDAVSIAALTGLTIYGLLEYLIETALTAQTGITFTLDALGTQDDGLINTIIPFPSGGKAIKVLNAGTPTKFDTYGGFISELLSLTKCFLRPRATLAFQVIYPQSSDAVNKTYYSAIADGHPFYENTDVKVGSQSSGWALPNHIEVRGGLDEIEDSPTFEQPLYIGHYYDPDHWDGATPQTDPQTYDGGFMPVIYTIYEPGLTSNADCQNRAAAEIRKIKAGTVGFRVLIPMDASVELFDRVGTSDTRG